MRLACAFELSEKLRFADAPFGFNRVRDSRHPTSIPAVRAVVVAPSVQRGFFREIKYKKNALMQGVFVRKPSDSQSQISFIMLLILSSRGSL